MGAWSLASVRRARRRREFLKLVRRSEGDVLAAVRSYSQMVDGGRPRPRCPWLRRILVEQARLEVAITRASRVRKTVR